MAVKQEAKLSDKLSSNETDLLLCQAAECGSENRHQLFPGKVCRCAKSGRVFKITSSFTLRKCNVSALFLHAEDIITYCGNSCGVIEPAAVTFLLNGQTYLPLRASPLDTSQGMKVQFSSPN